MFKCPLRPMPQEGRGFGSNNQNMHKLPIPQQVEKKRTDAIKHSINVPRKHARRDQNKLTAIRYNSGSSSPPYKEINPEC